MKAAPPGVSSVCGRRWLPDQQVGVKATKEKWPSWVTPGGVQRPRVSDAGSWLSGSTLPLVPGIPLLGRAFRGLNDS